MQSVLIRCAQRDLVCANLLFACAFGLISGASIAADLTDPTRPAAYKAAPDAAEPSTGRMRVEAILNRSGERLAIVDGKIVRAGDRIADAKIAAVTQDGVRYVQAGIAKFSRIETVRLLPVKRMTVAHNEDAP